MCVRECVGEGGVCRGVCGGGRCVYVGVWGEGGVCRGEGGV